MMKIASFLCGALLLLAFGRDARAGNCVPGAQAQCACPGGTLSVQVCSDDGARLGTCQCGVAAPPVGAGSGTSASGPTKEPATKRQSPGLFVTGLILTIVGAVAIPSGGALLIAGIAPHHDGCDDKEPFCPAGGTLLGIGVLSLGVGLPLMIIGGKQVPDDGSGRAAPWWQPTNLALSLSGARATWQF
jgi:hypothetical protein